MFRDSIFVLWPHVRESLVLCLDYINSLDTKKLKKQQKIKFFMEFVEPDNY